MATDTLSTEDQEFLARCEEELKDRYTEKDDDFMTVFDSVPSTPPVIDSWWVPNNFGRRNDHRNDRRNNKRYQPYDRRGRDDSGNYDRRDRGNYDRHDRGNYERRDRGYNDYGSSYDDRSQRYKL